MSFLGILLTIWLGLPTQAASTCSAMETQVRACMNGWGYERMSLPPPIDLQTGWIEAAKDHAARLRDSETRFVACAVQYENLVRTCGTHGLALAIAWSTEVLSRQATAEDTLNKINYLISAENGRLNSPRYALPCFKHVTAGYDYSVCFIVDRRATRHQYRQASDADDLPLRVGATDDCTFYVDEENRLVTADHCGRRPTTHAWPFGSNLGELTLTGSNASLPYDAKDYIGGGPFEDLSIIDVVTPPQPIGKTSYHLALDENLEADCELRSGFILACSRTAMLELGTKTAETLAFPSSEYVGDEGERRRVKPLSVMQARGPLFYEPRLERFYFHGYSRAGSSGAPVYIPAGVEVGGITLEHPLVIGVTSGSISASGKSGVTADNLAVVGVTHYKRLAMLLRMPRSVYATGTNP